MSHDARRRRRWKYKNTLLLALSVVALILVLDSAPVHGALQHLGELGYFGAFLAGVFFVSTFTVAPASVALFFIAEQGHPLYLALAAGCGAVLGDFLIFRFFKDRVFEELRPMFWRLRGSPVGRLFGTPYFAWLTPIVGAVVIASPLPDELGIGLLGQSKLKNWQFLLLTFLLNTIGIFVIVSSARLLG